MRGNPVRILGVLIAIASSPSWAADPVVEGTAFNRVTRAGVAGVTVKLGSHSAVSDASGAFRFDSIPEGEHPLSVTAPDGFFCRLRSNKVRVGEKGARIEIPLIPYGSLRGRVLDPDGRPVPHMRVEVFRAYGNAGHFLTTDAAGGFGETGIVPGLYILRARPVLEGSILARKSENRSELPGAPREGDRWMWCPTYYPNATEIGSAQPVYVREGVQLGGLDIRLRAAPVYKLRGLVLDHEEKPAAGVSLVLESEIGWGAGEVEVRSAADGSFEFPSVRAGDWHIEATRKRDGVAWMARIGFTMPARDYDRVRVRIDPPFPLTGSHEGLPPDAYVRVSLQPVDEPEGDRESSGRKQADGRLLFSGLYPGRYRAYARTEARGFYIKAVLLGPDDITGRDVDLSPSSPPLRFVFAPNAARATGTVEGAGDHVAVVLIDADPQVYVPGAAIRVGLADESGHFTVDGLRPGAWHAFAFDTQDNMNTDAIHALVFERGLARQAEVIRLGEGETANLKLRISPWFE